MVAVTGGGPWPGTDIREAQAVVVGDLTSVPAEVDGMPFCVSLPDRGPWSDAVGAALALLVGLPAELGPHGWRLADHPGRDQARAQALAREDLDALAVAAYGYAGPLVVPVTGPLTLAAELYLARGDRVISDIGAVRELAESLGMGIAEHLSRLRTAVPGARPIVLLHEGAAAQVLAGAVPSFSGRAPLRSVPAPVAAGHLRTVLDAVRAAGPAQVAIDVGPAWTVVGTAVSAGPDAVGVEVGAVDPRGWERLAETVEGGVALWASLPSSPSVSRTRPEPSADARTLLDPWRSVGLPDAALADVVLVSASGPGGGAVWTTPDDARAVIGRTVRAGQLVAERAHA